MNYTTAGRINKRPGDVGVGHWSVINLCLVARRGGGAAGSYRDF